MCLPRGDARGVRSGVVATRLRKVTRLVGRGVGVECKEVVRAGLEQLQGALDERRCEQLQARIGVQAAAV